MYDWINWVCLFVCLLCVRERIEGPHVTVHLAAKAICIENFTTDSYSTTINKCNLSKARRDKSERKTQKRVDE